jgi:hypothetical protein
LGVAAGLKRRPGAPDAARSITLVGLVGAPLGLQLLVQPPPGVLEALGPRARDRPGLVGAPLLEPVLGLAQPHLATLGLGQLGRQLVAARPPKGLVLGGVGDDLLLDDGLGELLVVHRAVAVGVGRHFGAVDRDHPDRRQAGVGAQGEHLAEELAQCALVTHHEPRDRGVVGPLLGGDHPAGHVLQAGALDCARRPHAARPAIQQQRDHHRRLIGRPPMTVLAIGGVERRRVHHPDGVDHKPRQVVLGQPLPDIRRQQKRLLAVTRDEVLRHARNRLKRSGRHDREVHARAALGPCVERPATVLALNLAIEITVEPGRVPADQRPVSEEFAARGFRQVSFKRDAGLEIYRGIVDSSLVDVLRAVPGVASLTERAPADALPLSERDWRILPEHETILRELSWRRRPYRAPHANWDHEHCVLCWTKFIDPTASPSHARTVATDPSVLVEGYATADDNWLCPKCFGDFREHFAWKVATDTQ